MTWAFLFETDQYLSKLDNEETGNAFCFSEGWGPGRNEGHVMAEALNVHEQTGLTPAQLQARVAELEGAQEGRTDEQILDQTNELARKLYLLRGYEAPAGFQFWKATHPHEVEAWEGACEAQLLLTDTDPRDAIDEGGE